SPAIAGLFHLCAPNHVNSNFVDPTIEAAGVKSILPYTPLASSLGTAAKNSVVDGWLLRLLPKAMPHNPSIVITSPLGVRSWPRGAPLMASNALIVPSPKFPTRRLLQNSPKTDGAIAIPQGALSVPP